jgi:hypothetical protein
VNACVLQKSFRYRGSPEVSLEREAMIAVGVCKLLKYFQIKAESPDLVIANICKVAVYCHY